MSYPARRLVNSQCGPIAGRLSEGVRRDWTFAQAGKPGLLPPYVTRLRLVPSEFGVFLVYIPTPHRPPRGAVDFDCLRGFGMPTRSANW